MPEDRWDIFSPMPMPIARIGLAMRRRAGGAAGAGRAPLGSERVIVTQGGHEPARFAQQRPARPYMPSLYDLRNLFQVNVEEGRQLWGDGPIWLTPIRTRRPREADEAAGPPPGDLDKPRISAPSTSRSADWLSSLSLFHRQRRQVLQLKSLEGSGVAIRMSARS